MNPGRGGTRCEAHGRLGTLAVEKLSLPAAPKWKRWGNGLVRSRTRMSLLLIHPFRCWSCARRPTGQLRGSVGISSEPGHQGLRQSQLFEALGRATSTLVSKCGEV